MRACLSIAFVVLAASAAAQEKFSGSNVDVRTVLAFKVSDVSVQKVLPDGWEVTVMFVGAQARGDVRVYANPDVPGATEAQNSALVASPLGRW